MPHRAAARTWCPESTAHRRTLGRPGQRHETALPILVPHILGPMVSLLPSPDHEVPPPCCTPRAPTKLWQALKVRLDTMRRQGEQSAVAQLSGRKRVWPSEVKELGTCQLSRKGAGSSASVSTDPSFRVRSLAASPSQTPEKGIMVAIGTKPVLPQDLSSHSEQSADGSERCHCFLPCDT